MFFISLYRQFLLVLDDDSIIHVGAPGPAEVRTGRPTDISTFILGVLDPRRYMNSNNCNSKYIGQGRCTPWPVGHTGRRGVPFTRETWDYVFFFFFVGGGGGGGEWLVCLRIRCPASSDGNLYIEADDLVWLLPISKPFFLFLFFLAIEIPSIRAKRGSSSGWCALWSEAVPSQNRKEKSDKTEGGNGM